MSFWTAAVIIVGICMLSEVYRARLKTESKKSAAAFDELAERMAQLEKRMANIETIVLDQEKSRPFAGMQSE